MRSVISSCAVFIVLAFAILPNSNATDQSKILVFAGRAVTVTPMPRLNVSCGVAAPQLLIKYKVEKIYAGAYEPKEIIIDHLACGSSGISAIQEGENLVVVAKLVPHVSEEIDSLGMRTKSPNAKQYFLALSVGKPVFTMN